MWPSYFSKVSWQRKSWPLKGETDSKGMMIFARPSGSGYPSQLEAIIPYGSTKAYSQRPTLVTRIFHIPLTRLTWLVWNIQVCSVRSKIPLQPQQFDLSGSVKTYHSVLPKMGIPTKWESQKPNNQLRPGILADGIKYTVSLSGKAFVRQPPVGQSLKM